MNYFQKINLLYRNSWYIKLFALKNLKVTVLKTEFQFF